MATDSVETITFTIESDQDTDEVTVPATLVELLAEDGQSDAEAVGDIALLSFASRAHHLVHHGEEVEEEYELAEESVMELFEDRFGVTFGEATGHQH